MSETMISGTPEDYLVGLTKPSVDRILKMDNPGDCLALYTFYCYTRKWQKNSSVYATSFFAMKALGWGKDRFHNAKKQLKAGGFVEDIHRNVDGGKIRWFVAVKFAQSSTTPDNHPTENPHSGESADKYLGMVNKIPRNGKEIQAEAETSAMASDSEQALVSPKEDVEPEVDADADSGKSDDLIQQPPSGENRITRRERKKSPPTTIPPELDCRDFREAWSDFLAHRKEKRKPVTPTSQTALFKNFVQWGESRATEALRTTVMNGWVGVFEPKEEKWRPTTI